MTGSLGPKVKICGVCRPADAAVIAAAGVGCVGVILAPGGKRSRALLEAAAIFTAAPGCARVGVFVDADPATVREAALRLDLDVVQLHGAEPSSALAELASGRWQVWKALRPRAAAEFLAGIENYASVAQALLLDGWSGTAPGGTGARFPWEEIAAVRSQLPGGLRLVVAGGLHPDNLARARAYLAPDVVDVSSGVESGSGVKDPALVRAFVAAARAPGAHVA
jgi:phosphoribosylanthranilate isomerase